jgi:hypothetical protein
MTVAPSASREMRPIVFIASALGLIAAFLALPVVLFAGGPISGWALGVGLWLANWLAQLAMAKVAFGLQPTTAVGISGVSFIARAWIIAIVLFIVAARFDRTAGLTAAGVFLAAFTFDLMGRTLLFTVNERARKQELPE